MDKDLNKQVDKLEDTVKQYASKDTVISIGGYSFTPAKLMLGFTIVSSILGGLYGVFEVYKDYMGMKKKIADYVSPDLSNIDKRLAVLEEGSAKAQKTIEDSASKTADYTRDIKNDLKADIRKNEAITEQVERSVKQAQRDIDQEMRNARKEIGEDLNKARSEANQIRKEMSETKNEIAKLVIDTKREILREIDQLKKEVDSKIQKAIDNPLANK